ncbi:DMT family transporter [Streptomyces sp. NPDC050264]|uniref:DMT family transporter n=1 Tax=Streptomyces sp. NPDC050264 TaxID=3155038 RepID=UPI00343E8D23
MRQLHGAPRRSATHGAPRRSATHGAPRRSATHGAPHKPVTHGAPHKPVTHGASLVVWCHTAFTLPQHRAPTVGRMTTSGHGGRHGRAADWLLACAGGVLLTLMTRFNAELAAYSTAAYASWIAHALGAAVALGLVGIAARRPFDPPDLSPGRAPLWFHLGGIPGALVVTLSAIAVNSDLALAGTTALMLTGQILFGIASDAWGLLRVPRRRITGVDLASALCVLGGSLLIVTGGA